MALRLRNLAGGAEPQRASGIGQFLVPASSTTAAPPSDPYAAIRELNFTTTMPDWMAGDSEGRGGEVNDPALNNAVLQLGDNNLGNFQSKYNTVYQVPGVPDTYAVTMQRPGEHKYNTMEAFYKVDPATGKGTFVGTPMMSEQQSSAKDIRDGLAQMAPYVLTAMGVPAGIAVGGSAVFGGDSLEDAIKKGATAALTQGAVEGIGSYLNTPTVPSAAEGIEGFSGLPEYAIDPPTAIGNLGGAASNVPNALEEYLNSGASDMSSASGQGGYAGAIFPNTPEILGTFDPSAYQTPTVGPTAPTGETIEITGQRPVDVPTPSLPVAGGIGAVVGGPTPLPPEPTTPGGRLTETATTEPSVGDRLTALMKNNPRLALQLMGSLGGLFGGRGSGGADAGGGLGSSQAGMTAQQAPKFQRQYVAPPPGYRPGFDPEHKYFTGIGAVGTGG